MTPTSSNARHKRYDVDWARGSSNRRPLHTPNLHLVDDASEAASRGDIGEVLKRTLDIVVSALALAVLAPLFALIALGIALSSRGSILFTQERPGRHGMPFRMLKFRTMHTDAERILHSDPALYAMFLEHDCKLPPHLDRRLFGLGRLLRKTSIDELPQLWNVLKGDMSLVGPRPVVGPELAHYEDVDLLLSVRPGLTGEWQVSGRSNVRYPMRAVMDLSYVRNWSLQRDLIILLNTIPSILRGDGAY